MHNVAALRQALSALGPWQGEGSVQVGNVAWCDAHVRDDCEGALINKFDFKLSGRGGFWNLRLNGYAGEVEQELPLVVSDIAGLDSS